MNPKKGTRSGQLPFREGIAMDEPFPGPGVPQSAGDVMVFPRIRWREPLLNVLLQLVACQIVLVHPVSNDDMKNG
jgi:hypothetical protein